MAGQIDLGRGLVNASYQEAHCGATVGRGRGQQGCQGTTVTCVFPEEGREKTMNRDLLPFWS